MDALHPLRFVFWMPHLEMWLVSHVTSEANVGQMQIVWAVDARAAFHLSSAMAHQVHVSKRPPSACPMVLSTVAKAVRPTPNVTRSSSVTLNEIFALMENAWTAI
jgi:hypothetical protein